MEDTKVADIFTEDINSLTEHLNIVITAHNKQLDLIDQLTNNWNELEEWLLNHYEVENKIQNECIDEILNKMKEIKESNNV